MFIHRFMQSDNWTNYSLLLLLLNALFISSLKGQDQIPPNPRAISIFQTADSLLIKVSKYQESKSLFKKAALVYQNDSDWNGYCKSMLKIAQVHQILNQFDSCILAARKVLDQSSQIKNERKRKFVIAEAHNNIGIAQDYTGNYKQALIHYKKALHIREEEFGPKDTQVAVALNNIGIVFDLMGVYDSAIFYHEKALNIRINIFGEDDANTAFSYHNLAVIYAIIGANENAFELEEKALKIRRKKYGEKHRFTAGSYVVLAKVLRRQGKYSEALLYLKRSKAIYEELLGSRHPRVGITLVNMADIYRENGDLEAAKINTSKGLILYRDILGKIHEKTLNATLKLADLQIQSAEYDSIAHYLNKSLQHAKTKYGNDNYLIARFHQLLGKLYVKLEAYHKAKRHLKLAVEIAKKYIGNNNGNTPKPYLSLSQVYDHQGNYDSALYYLNNAIESNTDASFDRATLPKTNTVIDKQVMLECYLAQLNLIDKVKGNSAIFSKETLIDACEELLLSLRNQNLDYKDRLNLAKFSEQVYSKAIDFYYPINEELAFVFAEKNHSGVLVRLNTEAKARSLELIPQEISRQIEKNAALSTNIRAKINTEENEEQIKRLESKLLSLYHSKDSLYLSLEKKHPEYFNFIYNPQVISLKDIQHKLNDQTAILEYHIGERFNLLFVITKSNFQVLKLENLDQNSINENLRLLQFRSNNLDFAAYENKSHQLFKEILLPAIESLNPAINHLKIIPHRILNFVPFEALVANKQGKPKSFQSLDYLIRQYEISYGNSSSSVVKESSKKETLFNNSADVLAMAPTFDNRDIKEKNELRTLQWADTEVNKISDYFTVEKVIGEKANEEKFRSLANQFQIVHLATHGLINDENPFYSKIVFAHQKSDSIHDGYVHTEELFGIPINAELTVLSACKTAKGTLVDGEGVLSLAQGFFFAGVESVVMSLWTANDKSTSIIMGDFYKYLSEGKRKSEALRQAKLDYITNADEVKSHPYFWAHFIANGNMKPVVKTSWVLKSLFIFATLITLGAIFRLVILLIRKYSTR